MNILQLKFSISDINISLDEFSGRWTIEEDRVGEFEERLIECSQIEAQKKKKKKKKKK